MGWKFPEIPRPRPIVHLHYLEHFGASDHEAGKHNCWSKKQIAGIWKFYENSEFRISFEKEVGMCLMKRNDLSKCFKISHVMISYVGIQKPAIFILLLLYSFP